VLNKELGTTFEQYKVEGKDLQLKWTDLEIRKYQQAQAQTIVPDVVK
jgi:hypothetical protein